MITRIGLQQSWGEHKDTRNRPDRVSKNKLRARRDGLHTKRDRWFVDIHLQNNMCETQFWFQTEMYIWYIVLSGNKSSTLPDGDDSKECAFPYFQRTSYSFEEREFSYIQRKN
jgi:hypothetical protein